METSLFWLLSAALFYLLCTSAILLRNRLELTALAYPGQRSNASHLPKISVCIPARNEESNIANLLDSVCSQTYPRFDIHILDDHSEDATPQILQQYQTIHSGRLMVHQGLKKPKNWFGKPWACQQLADLSNGELLLFLDADTRLEPDVLFKIAHSFRKWKLDVITVWPRQQMQTFWEKTVIPLVYYALLSLLPAVYVYRDPRWLPAFFKKKLSPKFAAACGQCIGFTRGAYRVIGGHASVKQKIVEDVELAKAVKREGLTLRMFHGVGSITCRMYRSEREMFEGLRKNFFAGFGVSLPLFLSAAALHIIVYILPFITFLYALWVTQPALLFLSGASITLILLHRLILSVWFRWNPIYAFTHPLGVAWFQRLAWVTMIDHFTRRKTTWKGRTI